jgi:hypothetical protein
MCPGHEGGSDVRWLPFIERAPEGEADIKLSSVPLHGAWTSVTR